MTRRHWPQVGDCVRSHYRARWSGTVVEVIDRSGANPLCYVRQERDRCGRPMRLQRVVVLDAAYLERLP